MSWLGLRARSLIAAAFLAGAAPIRAGGALDYFSMSIPGAWMAVDPGDAGTLERISEREGCDGRTTFHLVKGGRRPWASESFFLEGGWIFAMVEIGYDGARIREYRSFRDADELKWGIRWLPEKLDGEETRWEIPPYVEEHWSDEDGRPRCRNTRHVDRKGSLTHMSASVETLPGWLHDYRGSSKDRRAVHDVESLRVVRDWGARREIYWYGRWRDPGTGSGESLGLVRWELWCLDGDRPTLAEHRAFQYIVDAPASPLPPCAVCPFDQDAAP